MTVRAAMASSVFSRPNTPTATTYSSSVTGVVSTLRRLRVQVSSMTPVVAVIWTWNRTWKSTIPASRYAVPARLRRVLAGHEHAERAPQDDVHQRPEADLEPTVG